MGAQGLGEERGTNADVRSVAFWDDENILNLDHGGSCTNLVNVLKQSLNCTLTQVNFMVFILHLNKDV